MKLKFFFVLFTCLQLVILSQEKLPYQNPNLPIEERVNDLVARMTLVEKISQMVYNSPAIERLGIPEYNWWNEALHGVARNGIATVFPQAIGLAATWDNELMNRISTVISDEARAKYNKAISRNKRGIYQGITLWSPNINIFRDPRWGRGMETYGEDPYLTGEMAVQFVKGLQGNDSKYLKTIATVKHLAVHSGPEPDRHTFNAVVSDYDLRETYLPHFKKSVIDGKVYSVMCAYNRFRGDACCGSDPLIQQILRDEWGFKGLMVSDCWAVPDMYNFHKIVATPEEASAIAVKAGTDLECGNAYPSLGKAVKEGLINEDELNTAVKRIFTARYKLGMFDPPEMVPFSSLNKIDTPENKSAALEAARKSIVLLKNENNLLPLKKDLSTIAVLGPNANDVEVLLGNYNGFPSEPVTPLQGIKNKLGDTKIIYERGCELAENLPSFEVVDGNYLFTSADKKQQGLRGEYFDNRDFKGEPAFSRIDSKIDFAWWDGAPDEKFDPDNFGVRWSGVLIPEKSGEYSLGGYGFNGFKIYLEDSLLVSFDGEFDPVKTYKNVNLTGGRAYKIKIEFYKKLRYSFMQLIWSVPDENLEQRAIAAAQKSDAVIMVMGLSPRLEGEEMKVEVKGFKGGDRLTLDLPETQSKFIKKIYSLGKPVVLVLLNGSAVSINWENENIPAIVEAWYPGQAAGTAIADIIFGDYNPSGRLPVTFYKSVDQLPAFTDYEMSSRTYRYFKGEPLYPFGYGLSYTSFTYSRLALTKKEICPDETTILSVDVTNTGKVKGEEVVQLYIKAENDNKTVKTLKGFKRVALKPGETKKVDFEITRDILSRWINGKSFSVEADNYTLMVGGSSNGKDLSKINLVVK
ncbi:MAG: glycoside hydrolase family 3 C-terminal domain-containing protein [Ignavibacteriales bacterium]|nr:glycoside hydrolase family 3 C-terminal domain-containing protein [Ignavibacteriales bacterium]